MISNYDILIVAIISICTFITRLFPFVLFGRGQQPPKIVRYLGKALPGAVIAILIVYCMKTADLLVYNSYVPHFISIAVVAALHIWKRNNLLSIGAGTILFMILIQNVFI